MGVPRFYRTVHFWRNGSVLLWKKHVQPIAEIPSKCKQLVTTGDKGIQLIIMVINSMYTRFWDTVRLNLGTPLT